MATGYWGKTRAASVALAVALAFGAPAASAVGACDRPGALGVKRIVEIDASSGPHFGDISRNVKEPSFLQPKEVVLTFDDGPMPGITKQILDTLDRFCTKATFFHVGRMALAYPGLVKEVIARGHTVGTHTWSHPLNLRRLSASAAQAEIEKGFAATTLAAGEPIAPFFRFPGLNDTPELLTWLQGRGAATFTVDVVSNDSYIQSSDRLVQTTLARVEAHGGGIVLFHDIKPQTARALPAILTELEARGYTVVHLLSRTRYTPDPATTETVRAIAARGDAGRPASIATAFALPMGPVPVTRLAPPPRVYGVTRLAAVVEKRRQAAKPPARVASHRPTGTRTPGTVAGPWVTSVKRYKRVTDVR